MNIFRPLAARIVGHCIRLFARAITAVRADWQGIEPVPRQRVYYSNHTSNADMPMIWSVLPPVLRRTVRPLLVMMRRGTQDGFNAMNAALKARAEAA
jgi:1-acyl-sn-glycerol-3-phosphate acyltransferase